MRGRTIMEAQRKLAAKGLLVNLGIQHDGGVYRLDYHSEKRIAETFPEAIPLPMIMLGHNRDTEFDRLHPSRWERMILLLTGLTWEQIAQLGGVAIFDADNERVVWEWRPEAVSR